MTNQRTTLVEPQHTAPMQDILQMCSFDGTKSTKGASKLRRDLINAEIGQLRDLLPLPPSTRQRLSQLQLMALVCVYVRKSNYFQQVYKQPESSHTPQTPSIGFSKALSGFLMMMTQGGKLLYISDNAAEYLGHSMEDLLIHGDSVYDMIDKQDHASVQAELVRGAPNSSSTTNGVADEQERLFLCRMNVSRNARRQMRFGDQKVVLMQGRYLSFLPLCSRNEPVFLAHCTPVALPETRECVVQGATNVFTSVHTMDMKFLHLDRNGEFYLGYSRGSLAGVSWYHLLHPENMREAQSKHRLITSSEQDRSCIVLVRLQAAGGSWRWVHSVLQVKESSDITQQTQSQSQTQSQTQTQTQTQQQQPVIVATNQVLSEREANVLRNNSWLYHYYTMQSKLQYGLAYEAAHAQRMHAAAAYYPPVMTYQAEAAATTYMNPTTLNGGHHSHTPTAGHTTTYSLATPSAYAHLQHYPHHYSVRLHHNLDYKREPAWGYYNSTSLPTTASSSMSGTQTTTHSASSSTPVTSKTSKKADSPKGSRRHSTTTASNPATESGGVAVAAPIAVRATPAVVQKGMTSTGASAPELEDDNDIDGWKSSPTQVVPDYPEYSPFITPPYSATTPTKHHVFTFEPSAHESREAAAAAQDQHVPSLDVPWYSDLPSRGMWPSPESSTPSPDTLAPPAHRPLHAHRAL
ncbi:uncharacterized protein LOC143041546 isoform X2 [Oratosquilla oratoria]|uniref:uncharacterized protein LOC143041546 isoform X2 n=1 Tax=Oratosquilla oratoria TaxID=337810 RepID=UPI003F76A78A